MNHLNLGNRFQKNYTATTPSHTHSVKFSSNTPNRPLKGRDLRLFRIFDLQLCRMFCRQIDKTLDTPHIHLLTLLSEHCLKLP